MELLAIAITVVAGTAMGWINNLAGGAGVFGLLAFEYAWGMPLSQANPSTRLAAVAIGVFAWLGFRRAGRAAPAGAWGQALIALPGALLGAELARGLPDLVFRIYLAAVLALLLWQQLGPARAGAAAPRSRWLRWGGCFLIGLHMGYVQVGTGLVATLVLAGLHRDLLVVNAAKSVVVIVTSVTSVGSFVAHGAIAWLPAGCLAAGAALGSYLASHWSVKKGADAVRRVVVVVAVLTLLEQLRQIALAFG